MYNHHSFKSVNPRLFGTLANFRVPDPNYNFWLIPHTIRQVLLGGNLLALPNDCSPTGRWEQKKKVFAIFCNAMGEDALNNQCGSIRLLQESRTATNITISKYTAQAPSNTVNATMSFHTGQPVSELAMYDRDVYSPEWGTAFVPFFGRELYTDRPLAELGLDLRQLFPAPVLYREYMTKGIHCVHASPRNLENALADKTFREGTEWVSLSDDQSARPDLVGEQIEEIAQQHDRMYTSFYFDPLDRQCHPLATEHRLFLPDLAVFLESLASLVGRLLKFEDSLVLVFADHGHATTHAQCVAHRAHIKFAMPDIEDCLKRDMRGVPLRTGNQRNVFLHVLHDKVRYVQETLSKAFAGVAEAWRTEDLVVRGVFGQVADLSRFIGRVGNLMLFPYNDCATMWDSPASVAYHRRGAHGGLSIPEMDCLLFAAVS